MVVDTKRTRRVTSNGWWYRLAGHREERLVRLIIPMSTLHLNGEKVFNSLRLKICASAKKFASIDEYGVKY
jgi:hypothetical protein